MTYISIKRTTVFTMIIYIFMVFSANYTFAHESKNADLILAEKFYNEGDQGASLRAIDSFLTTHSYGEDKKDDFCFAYFLQGKIYFEAGNNEKMKAALCNLFSINPNFEIPSGEYESFKTDAQIIQKSVKNKTEKPCVIEKKGDKTKKKFPWLIAGAVVVGVIIVYFLLSKKPKRTLTVSMGEGVDGTPVSGTTTHKNGASVNYNYSVKSGYGGLSVKLDGKETDPSGTVKMDTNHTLTITALKAYTLYVAKYEGVNGTPDTGSVQKNIGETVNYNYSLQDRYQDLRVTLDGLPTTASGNIIMNSNHVLDVRATPITYYTLNVSKGDGIDGTPDSGQYPEGTQITCNYSLQHGYTDMNIKLDGADMSPGSTFIMNQDHNLTVTAKKITNRAPTIVITSPVNGATVGGIVLIKAQANDDFGIKHIEFYVDGTWRRTVKADDPNNTLSFDAQCSWDTTGLTNKISHPIKVKTYDVEDLYNEYTITVTVENPVINVK
jgi:hypothetical protein